MKWLVLFIDSNGQADHDEMYSHWKVMEAAIRRWFDENPSGEAHIANLVKGDQ